VAQNGNSKAGALAQIMALLLEKIQQAEKLEDVLDFILRQAVTLLNAKRGDIVMLDTRGELRVVAVIRHTPYALQVGDVCPAKSFMRHVFGGDVKITQRIGDVNLLPDGQYHCSDTEIVSEAATPLELGGQRLGVLNVESILTSQRSFRWATRR
jgi:GAF domain-containing protein